MRRPEVWKPIPGYGGLYEASTRGRVRSWKLPGRPPKTGPKRAARPKLLKPITNHDGYSVLSLGPNGASTRQVRLNRIILLTFIGPPPKPDDHASHLNGRKHDNRLENLSYETRAENYARMILHNPTRYSR